MKFTQGPSMLPISTQVAPADLVPTINDRLRRLGNLVSNIQTTLVETPAAAFAGWKSYIPVFSASGGMTVTLGTINVAEYLKSGNICFFRLEVEGITTGGTASNEIFATVPPVAPIDFYSVATAEVSDGAAPIAGICPVGTSQFAIRRYDGANYGLGVNRAIVVAGFYHC